jgi:hypothetical protein
MRDHVRIVTTDNFKIKQDRQDANPVQQVRLQRMTVTRKPDALPVVLVFFNRLGDRITATRNVAQAQSLEQVPVHARIATTDNFKINQDRQHANLAEQVRLQ